MHHRHGIISSKLLWNSTISTPGACFAGVDIKNMYLKTPFDHFKYMRMSFSLFPTNIIDHYQLNNKVLKDYVYMEIRMACTAYPKPAFLPTSY